MINKIKERWKAAKIETQTAKAEVLLQMGIDKNLLGYSFDMPLADLEDEEVRKDIFSKLKVLAEENYYQISETIADENWNIKINKTLLGMFLTMFEASYPQTKFNLGTFPNADIVFPARHPDTGDIQVWDDGDELTIGIGDFFHTHFDPVEQESDERTKDEAKVECVASAVSFVGEFLDDRKILYVQFSGEEPGAVAITDYENDNSIPLGAKKFVWSGPID